MQVRSGRNFPTPARPILIFGAIAILDFIFRIPTRATLKVKKKYNKENIRKNAVECLTLLLLESR